VEGVEVLPQIKAMIKAGVPVMGHLGLTPQRVAALGGYSVQGKSAEAAQQCIDDARRLADAGCFSIVLETIPAVLAARITEAVPVPTIGIGAGPDCDGQVLVFHDLLGLYDRFAPKFVKRYAALGGLIAEALTSYAEEVRSGAFPGPEHSFAMDPKNLETLT
jgi:3-methyl-2-oxobutanoate hydroxymethyltransferase